MFEYVYFVVLNQGELKLERKSLYDDRKAGYVSLINLRFPKLRGVKKVPPCIKNYSSMNKPPIGPRLVFPGRHIAGQYRKTSALQIY